MHAMWKGEVRRFWRVLKSAMSRMVMMLFRPTLKGFRKLRRHHERVVSPVATCRSPASHQKEQIPSCPPLRQTASYLEGICRFHSSWTRQSFYCTSATASTAYNRPALSKH